MISEAEKAFHDFLASHGHPLETPINHDSRDFHYFKCPNGGSTDARYKFFPDGIPCGYLKCWHCNIEADFCSKQKHEVPLQQWRTHIKRMTEFKKKNEIESQEKHTAAAKEAQRIWDLASEENAPGHRYLSLKHVKSYGLRVLRDDVTYEVYPQEFDENGKEKIFTVYKNTLLVPCYDIKGNLVNLERIYFDKKENKFQKRPLKGGQRIGTYYMLGKVIDQHCVILIGEGYSTMATVFEAMKDYPCVISFNCGNIFNVAEILRKKYPENRLVIIADDDRWHNDSKRKDAGVKAAKKTCKAVKNTTYMLPDFSVLEGIQ